jgi:hypothetical protein
MERASGARAVVVSGSINPDGEGGRWCMFGIIVKMYIIKSAKLNRIKLGNFWFRCADVKRNRLHDTAFL